MLYCCPDRHRRNFPQGLANLPRRNYCDLLHGRHFRLIYFQWFHHVLDSCKSIFCSRRCFLEFFRTGIGWLGALGSPPCCKRVRPAFQKEPILLRPPALWPNRELEGWKYITLYCIHVCCVGNICHVIFEYHYIASEICAAFCVKYDPKKSEFFKF